ncbi:hypothetical protein VHUM_02756 [Vanrija humicola]|uniref:Xylanolytic transcriptional activator regulatory domain-containing protein n=1 Tax=Vanrija humicola TaxID=5417 RepID=A0A7D8V0V5_VANHU|nr:hypothetical protein VHUM_02756 [Vanrija humicola]
MSCGLLADAHTPEQLEERIQGYEARLAAQEAGLASVTAWQGEVTSSLALPTPSASASAIPAPFPFELAPTPAVALTTISPAPSAGSFLDPHVLPPDDIVRDLIALYFSHIAPWAPILPPGLQQQFAAPWSIVVYAIVVVTLRLSADPRIAGTKQQLRAAAKSHVLSHAIESTSIASVQALALLALDLIGSEQGPSSWGILALLTRSAVHLGLVAEDEGAGGAGGTTRVPSNLSRTSIIPPAHDWREDEARRRLFWLIFSLDRYACASTGWDFALPDFDIRRRLPCSDEIWAGGTWHTAPLFKPVLHRDAHPDTSALSPMAYLVEALDLLGRSHSLQSRVLEAHDAREVEHRKDMVMTLTAAAKRWFADVPLAQMAPGPMPLVIAGVYHATLLKLNAYYAYPALSNGAPVEPYGGTCAASAAALVRLVAQARELGFRQASSPLFIWSAWVAARVLFIHSFLAHHAHPDDNFEAILQALREQAAYWSLANQYVKLLERAKRKWAAGTTHTDPDANPSLPDAIHVLLDLRRTAYSAVGATDQTPYVSPPDVNLSHLPAWAVQPLLGDLHNWFDLPAGLFADQ